MKHNIEIVGSACCGCALCAAVCPTGAIRMTRDSEGFSVPSVDEASCTQCGICAAKCPIQNPLSAFSGTQAGYAAHCRDEAALALSSSGGVFFAVADSILAQNGAVFGCVWGRNFEPVFAMAQTRAQLAAMQGSKYVQGRMDEIYPVLRDTVRAGRPTLFCGTPCQVAAVRQLFSGDTDNLYCMDLICHGVPSYPLFRSYLHFLEKRHGGTVVSYQFRSKTKHGWSLTFSAGLRRKNGTLRRVEKMASLDPYYQLYLRGSIHRESCYHCPYANARRIGDLTIGDFWGIEREVPSLFDLRGVSCVLVNNEKGASLLAQASEVLDTTPVDTECIIRNNDNLNAPSARPALRDTVYRDWQTHGFDELSATYFDRHGLLLEKIKDRIPNRTRQRIKRLLKKLRW